MFYGVNSSDHSFGPEMCTKIESMEVYGGMEYGEELIPPRLLLNAAARSEGQLGSWFSYWKNPEMSRTVVSRVRVFNPSF